MFRQSRISLRTALVAVLLLAGLNAAHAQALRTVVIEGGKVYVDGRMLDQAELPDSLNLTGVTGRFTFLGDLNPVFQVGDRMVRLEDSRLVTVEGRPAGNPMQDFQLQEIQQQQLAQQYRQMEFQRYLNEVQGRDAELYQLLLREAQADQETLILAERIRAASTAEEKSRLERQLRVRVEHAFELKQEARRREIRELEAQLEELQARLKEREENRTVIIEHRVQDLLSPER